MPKERKMMYYVHVFIVAYLFIVSFRCVLALYMNESLFEIAIKEEGRSLWYIKNFNVVPFIFNPRYYLFFTPKQLIRFLKEKEAQAERNANV